MMNFEEYIIPIAWVAVTVGLVIIAWFGYQSFLDNRSAEKPLPPQDRVRRVLKPWKR